MRQLRWVLVALTTIGCGRPRDVVRPPSSALVDTRHTTLGELTASAMATIDFAPENAWRIADVVGEEGDVAWITQQPARSLVEPHDPASAWRRFVGSIERILPIEALL